MTELIILELLVVFLIDWVVEWCIVLMFFSTSYEITIWHHQYANTDLIKNVGESFDMNSAFFELQSKWTIGCTNQRKYKYHE